MRLRSAARTARSRTNRIHGALPRAVASRAGLVSRLVPRRVRMRLTLLYGLLFVISGAVLLTITYLLVNRPTSTVLVSRRGGSGSPGDAGIHMYTRDEVPGAVDRFAHAQQQQAMRQHTAEMQHLLTQSGIALAIMSVIAIGLGWLVAGRVLRPLRTITTTVQRISAHNVHERLAVEGPGDELKDLADTVDGLLGRLETALDSHKRFVANAAHELRTPLTVEHALLEESLIDRDATVDSFRANFERLLTLSEQQARLLESLLTLSGSERGLDRREPLDLAELTGNVLVGARKEADRRNLRVEAHIHPAGLWGDDALIERLVANLVDNAMGYNVPDGWVTVVTGVKDGLAFVRVSNTGPRIPPAGVSRLFEPFQRIGRKADNGHHGLGLSIVRSIAAAHDATLNAHARPQGGLVVEVGFPLRTTAPATETYDDVARALSAAPE
ncbi:HAMP domain-containing histidine kinase [Streptomyces sp. SID10115]|nr:HAMP domain-containing protein [Streptomyces sp. SID337]NDZ87964.1 HAMP domain-containing histidine kinase [Streptomyces sp. SID10115]NDZ99027.1 HAMP domain-containing histidine kinase [Streptomyces sp. SID10116]NEB46957.1 HAMP domain-containing histidine kinase [Streptomyces sp. SID339]